MQDYSKAEVRYENSRNEVYALKRQHDVLYAVES